MIETEKRKTFSDLRLPSFSFLFFSLSFFLGKNDSALIPEEKRKLRREPVPVSTENKLEKVLSRGCLFVDLCGFDTIVIKKVFESAEFYRFVFAFYFKYDTVCSLKR